MSQAIDRLVKQISLFSGLKESESLSRKLAFVLKGLSETDLEQWVQSIELDPYKQELPALVEDLNNHETYFFRDEAQMRILEQKIFPELINAKLDSGEKRVRIWSAACSSGEETYTLAMMLLQVFIDLKLGVKLPGGLILPPHGWKIEINGTDISRQVVRKASEGIYESAGNGLSSFRNFPPSYMDYFTLSKEYEDSLGNKKKVYRVNDVLKTFVKFDVFNLMSPMPPANEYDVVLCRNVMIYFDDVALDKAQRVIKSSLRQGGIFLLSAVDKLKNPIGIEVHREMGCVYYEKK